LRTFASRGGRGASSAWPKCASIPRTASPTVAAGGRVPRIDQPLHHDAAHQCLVERVHPALVLLPLILIEVNGLSRAAAGLVLTPGAAAWRSFRQQLIDDLTGSAPDRQSLPGRAASSSTERSSMALRLDRL
jgi:hypothetical protein